MEKNEIEDYLLKHGGAPSSEIIKFLEAKGNSYANARKKLSRASSKVMKLNNLNFRHNAKFYYLEEKWNSREYWNALLKAMRDNNSVYATALDGIQAKGGSIPKNLFPIISGSPTKQKGHVSAKSSLERLMAIQAIKSYDTIEFGECLYPTPFILENSSRNNLHARLVVEHIQLLAIQDWLKKLGLASYNKIEIRNPQSSKPPTISTTCWDLVGPSYLHPLASRANSKLKPGFVACDLFVENITSVHQIEYVIKKVRALSALKNVAPIMPIVVASNFEKDAFNKLKSEGIIAATLENLFGRETEKAFRSLLMALTNAATVATKKPELIYDLFTKLGAIEGAAEHLRGDLFEMIVGHLVHAREGYNIDIGEIVIDHETRQEREIDVRGVRGKELVWHCECKSHQPDYLVTLPEVKTWLTDKVPVIYSIEKKSRSDWNNHKFKFEFWTCGQFACDAQSYLKTQKRRIKKYEIDWKDGEEVRKYAKEANVRSICKTLDEHYFKHPLKFKKTKK